MPSSIPAAMLTEMKNHRERCFSTFEVDLNGTTHRWSDHPVGSDASGMYLKRVTQWGMFERSYSDRQYQLQGASGSVELEDVSDVLGKLFGGPLRGAVTNAVARAYVRSPEVDNANHWKFFDGRVLSEPALTGPRRYGLELGPNAVLLEALKSNIPRITKAAYSGAPPQTVEGNDENEDGTPGQAVYGVHRSRGLVDSFGLVPAIPVDTDDNLWYVSIGKLPNNLVGVFHKATGSDEFVDETPQWALEYVLVDGIWITVVRDISNGANQEEDEVRVDLDGIEVNGDGLGATITNPVRALEHYLVNFIFGDWPTGSSDGQAWLTSTADINQTHLLATEDFMADRAYTCSRVLTSDDRGIEVVNDWCSSWNVGAFWADDWKLGFRPLDHAYQDLETARLIRMEDHVDITDIKSDPRDDALVNRISVTWIRDHAGNALKRGPLRIVDTSRAPIISNPHALNWISASIVDTDFQGAGDPTDVFVQSRARARSNVTLDVA